MNNQLVIEPHGQEFRLLVNDGQAGIYDTLTGAKAGARRFISSYQRIGWTERDDGCWVGAVTHRRLLPR